MIVDSSAIIAILKVEHDELRYRDRIDEEPGRVVMSAGTWLEANVVIERAGIAQLRDQFDGIIADFGIEIAAFTPAQAILARDAYRTYGKGSGHPARLNFGDCFAYALAKETGDPLLFKGDDFALTDVQAALA
jgi:ribonuclease VapC